MSETQFAAALPQIKPKEFLTLRTFAHETFGLDLRDGNEALVAARLGKFLRAGGFASFEQYLCHVKSDQSGDSLSDMIDALTTNHTRFLREAEHFRFLTGLMRTEFRNRKSVRVWSAASSTGEEPWSILFTLLDSFYSGNGAEPRVIATDISTRVLRVARQGVYSAEKIGVLPENWVQRYFQPVDKRRAEFRVRSELRPRIDFRRLNLVQPLPAMMRYPVIFCRNVLIYFDKQMQASLVRRLADALEPGGYLLVGHSESLTGLDHPLSYVCPAVYRKAT